MARSKRIGQKDVLLCRSAGCASSFRPYRDLTYSHGWENAIVILVSEEPIANSGMTATPSGLLSCSQCIKRALARSTLVRALLYSIESQNNDT